MDRIKNDFYQLIKMNENLFDFISEAAPKGICFCKLGDTKQIWGDQAWKHLLGYNKQHLPGIDELIDKDHLQHMVTNLHGKDFDPAADYRIDYKLRNGEVLKTTCTGMVANGKADSSLWLFIAIKQLDVTERATQKLNDLLIELPKTSIHLNEALRISEERFRLTFENAAIGMAIIGLQGNWLRTNSSMLNILGYSPSELLRLTFQDLTHPDDLDKDVNLSIELIQGIRDSYQMEKRYFHKNGHIVWVILAVSIVKNIDGQPLHFIAQVTDISRVKETESRMSSALEEISDQNQRLLNFAHIVSHNLRSHTGNLSMLLDFIDSDADEVSRQELFNMLHHAAANLQETVGHLNEVAALNTRISENLVKTNLHNAIDGNLGSIEAFLKNADAICINDVNPGIYIDAVPAYLDSILLNFLTNAIKYRSTDRPLRINLSAETEGNLVVLSIQDNGIGIDMQAHREKIFGMYKTFHTNKDARGIGLFITKNQIEAMGGRVTVESELGIGTIFKIYFKSQK